ncbi:thiamine phosphate synthase [Sphingobium yanoikuyae]|uniref:Thiamine phosphate synthase n=2 Tax=Sphingobium yanoikuyae TaxID=13690 RepID=A0A6M4GB52_SPHYA|nr:thiamine phosphate synthase [Sphingobium yanoikuyae]
MAMHARHRKKLPGLWLMTDERVEDASLLAAAARLPRGRAGIVFRHYHTEAVKRRALFEALRAVARRRRLVLMLAGDARTAAAWRADGWHGRDGAKNFHRLIHSQAAHDRQELQAAARADMVFLSPLLPTRSHPGAGALGRIGFAALARQAKAPVIALGGIRAKHRHMLRGIGAAGWAAIDGLTDHI